MPKQVDTRGLRTFYILKEAVTARSEGCENEQLLGKGQVVLTLKKPKLPGKPKKGKPIATGPHMVRIAVITTTKEDEENGSFFYRIAPQTMASEQNDNSRESNSQYMISPKQPASTEPQVQVKDSQKLKSLPIPPGSYLKLEPSVLEVPSSTLAAATAILQNLEVRPKLVLTPSSSNMVDAHVLSILGIPALLTYWPQYSDEATHTIDLSATVEENTEAATEIEANGGGLLPPVYTPKFTSVRTAIQELRADTKKQAKSLLFQSSEESQLLGNTFKKFKKVPVLSKNAARKAELREIEAARRSEAIALQEGAEEPGLGLKSQVTDSSHTEEDNVSKVEALAQANAKATTQPTSRYTTVTTGKLYTLRSDINDLEKGQLVIVLNKGDCRKVEVAIVTTESEIEKKHAADRFTLFPLAPTPTGIDPSTGHHYSPLFVEQYQELLPSLPKRWFVKVEPYPILLTREILGPKLEKYSRTVGVADECGGGQGNVDVKEVHLRVKHPALRNIREEMARLIDPASKAGE